MNSLRACLVLILVLIAAPPALAQSTRFTVTVEGESGRDIILIPGLASSAAVWDGLEAQLRPRYRLHLIQVAGFAGTPPPVDEEGPIVAGLAEAIADYIRANGLRAPAVIGHSLGGETALMIAARHPDLVGRAMIVDALPFYSLLLDPSATPASARPQAEAARALLVAQTPEQARAFAITTMARLMKSEAYRPHAIAWATASDSATIGNAVHELMTTDLRPELGRITAPLTILYAHDPAYGVPAEQVETLFRAAYSNAPQARIERIDNSFHFIMIDQPRAFAAAVLSFLESR